VHRTGRVAGTDVCMEGKRNLPQKPFTICTVHTYTTQLSPAGCQRAATTDSPSTEAVTSQLVPSTLPSTYTCLHPHTPVEQSRQSHTRTMQNHACTSQIASHHTGHQLLPHRHLSPPCLPSTRLTLPQHPWPSLSNQQAHCPMTDGAVPLLPRFLYACLDLSYLCLASASSSS
jgi:hypothetical protein